jgi:hypothetical protein
LEQQGNVQQPLAIRPGGMYVLIVTNNDGNDNNKYARASQIE